MRIAVIGGAGFIGARLVDLLLEANHEVSILDKADSRQHPELAARVDVRDREGLDRALVGQELVVLLAAEHADDVSPTSLYYEVNVEGTANVLGAMDAQGIRRILFTSSVAVYGLGRDEPTEEDALQPFGHYGVSKYQAEELLRAWQAEGEDRDLTIVRPTVVFGEGNRGNVYNLLRQLASGLFVMIGPGTNRKSMAYVGNVAGFLRYCIERPEPGYRLFNYVDKPDLDMNQLVEMVRGQLGLRRSRLKIPYPVGLLGGRLFDLVATVARRPLPISAVRVQKFCATTSFSASRAAEYGFRPAFTLEEGLRRTLQAEFSADSTSRA